NALKSSLVRWLDFPLTGIFAGAGKPTQSPTDHPPSDPKRDTLTQDCDNFTLNCSILIFLAGAGPGTVFPTVKGRRCATVGPRSRCSPQPNAEWNRGPPKTCNLRQMIRGHVAFWARCDPRATLWYIPRSLISRAAN